MLRRHWLSLNRRLPGDPALTELERRPGASRSPEAGRDPENPERPCAG